MFSRISNILIICIISIALSVIFQATAAEDTWTKKSDMPTSRSRHSSSVVDGKIYAIGGLGGNLWGLSAMEVYNPATNTWTKKKDMPTARGMLSASVVDGRIYAIGGGTGGPPIAPFKEGIVEEYDTGFREKSIDPKGKLATSWGKLKAGY